jgi:hypothetical protein
VGKSPDRSSLGGGLESTSSPRRGFRTGELLGQCDAPDQYRSSSSPWFRLWRALASELQFPGDGLSGVSFLLLLEFVTGAEFSIYLRCPDVRQLDLIFRHQFDIGKTLRPCEARVQFYLPGGFETLIFSCLILNQSRPHSIR